MTTIPMAHVRPAARSDSSGEWHPEVVSWNITSRCNLRCGHCYLDAGQGVDGELSLEEDRELIDGLATAQTRMLILTGGEPLLRPDIVEIASHAAEKGLLVVLGTNGMLLTRQRVRDLMAAGVFGVGISVDSTDPEKHDRFRGLPGAWEGAVRGIRTCVEAGLPVLFQMTVFPWNRKEVTDMLAFAQRESATGFNLYFLVCTGRGEQLSDITPDQYDEALATLIEAQPRYPEMMVRARCAPQISRVASQHGSALIGNVGCLAGRQYCRITPNGDLTPCPYLPLVAGNVRDRPVAEVWRASPVLQRLRGEPPAGRCGRCEYQQLCGGCRARASALTGDLFGEDPWCAYQPNGQATVKHDSAPTWTPEAEDRLQRIPSFIRSRVRVAAEQHARTSWAPEVTPELMTAALQEMGRRIPFSRPRWVAAKESSDEPDEEAPRGAE